MYEIRLSEKIKKCLKYADKNVASSNWIKFDVLEEAVNKNMNETDIPITYQNVWFCLHNEKLRRPTQKGYTNTEVSFPSTMVERKKRVIDLIREAKKQKDVYKLAELCNVSHWTVYSWLNKNYKIPLSALMKSCQINDENFWEVLDGSRLWGKTYSVLYRDDLTQEDKARLEEIIDWINTDGHIRLKGWSFKISQLKGERYLLEKLRKMILNLFEMEEDSAKIYEYKKMAALKVDSAALRQLLVLKYGIRPGKKSKYIDVENLSMRRIANYLNAEGSFYFIGRGVGVQVLRSDSSSLVNKIYKFLSESGYHPSKSRSSVTLTRMKESLRFIVETWNYLSKKRKKQAIKAIQKPETFARLRVDTAVVRPLLQNYLKERNKESLHDLVNEIGGKYGISYSIRSLEHWIYPGNERDVPIFVVKGVCDEGFGKIEDYIPNYILKVFELANQPL